MTSKKNEMCVCPKCGRDGRMEDYEIDIDCLAMKYYCVDCGESWWEYAKLVYDGYAQNGVVYDVNGEEVDV